MYTQINFNQHACTVDHISLTVDRAVTFLPSLVGDTWALRDREISLFLSPLLLLEPFFFPLFPSSDCEPSPVW